MTDPIRVLILEDNPTDAELEQRALRRGGPSIDSHVVRDRAGFLEAFEQRWDIILADYQLPDMTGLDALRLAQEKAASVPVIVVTGMLGDEAAIQTLKHGAADYILKEHLERLGPAVRRALKEAANQRERHRLDAELKEAQRSMAETLSLLETLQTTAPVGLGFVDREYRTVRINERLAQVSGLTVPELLGKTVEEAVPHLWPYLEPIYREVFTTGREILDIELTGETAQEPGRMHTWLASYYPVRVEGEVIGAGVVVLDITDRKEAEREREQLTRSAASAIAAAVEARDPYTAGHQRRVAVIASAIASEIDLDPHLIEGIGLAAEIHDIGKVGVPAEILQRPGQLSRQEFELLKLHPQAGADIISGIKFPWPVAEMILQHHENLDGSGYPRGLQGDEILMGARILRVADVLEAMSSHRPYRPARGLEAALAEIEHGIGRKFDPAPATACLDLARTGRLDLPGWSVEAPEGTGATQFADDLAVLR